MATSRTKGRVIIPRNIREILVIASKTYAKHLADGAASPLNSLEDYKWGDVGPTVAKALADHEGAEALAAQAEKLFRQRDEAMTNINGVLRSSAGVLKGIYAKNPKRLADWGMLIDDSPKVKKEAVVKQ